MCKFIDPLLFLRLGGEEEVREDGITDPRDMPIPNKSMFLECTHTLAQTCIDTHAHTCTHTHVHTHTCATYKHAYT